MKTVRRTRITIREKELIIVKGTTGSDDSSRHTCPLCNSPIGPDTVYSIACGQKKTLDDRNEEFLKKLSGELDK
jgi:hypothetical protein